MKETTKNINQLLLGLPRGIAVTSSWLASNGINYRLQHHYSQTSNLLKSIGIGAYVINNPNEDVKIEGALQTLHSQLHLDCHIGALTALGSVHNVRHFIAFADEKLQIFAAKTAHIPKWFTKNFGSDCEIHKTQFLSDSIGIQEVDYHGFVLRASSPERALLESIFLCPNKISLREIAQIMESMTNLRPHLLQELLENCSSIKVKRVFSYLAEKYNHNWFAFIDLKNVDIGSGKRVINPSGKLDKKYLIVIDDLSEI